MEKRFMPKSSRWWLQGFGNARLLPDPHRLRHPAAAPKRGGGSVEIYAGLLGGQCALAHAFGMLHDEVESLPRPGGGEAVGAELFRGLDPQRAELYKLCSAGQVGITVMKTLGGGKLISAEHTPFARPLTVAQCVHYALSRPSVASVMLGAQTIEEVNAAVGYFDLDEKEKDYSDAIAAMKNDFRGNCVYCGHCQPCPSEIDIAVVNKYLDIARLTT